MSKRPDQIVGWLCTAMGIPMLLCTTASAQLPNPVLNSVFPPGGQAGRTIEVTVAGSALDGMTTLHCSRADIAVEHVEKDRFRITIPQDVPPGTYDLRVLCPNGLSSPRTFVVGSQPEEIEAEPNETAKIAQSVSLGVVINGRIEKGGDRDQFRFSAKQGQRVVIECSAERIDSRLRAVLEVYDERGRRLAVNRGYFGIDPLIDFHVPADGNYVVKLHDLIYSGSADHCYRLAIDTGPQVAFAVPSVVQRGKTTRVALYGWNLRSKTEPPAATAAGNTEATAKSGKARGFDRVEVDITPPEELRRLALRLRPAQVAVDGFAYQFPGARAPLLIGVTDVPVVIARADNGSRSSAQQITFPCEVSGQLIAGDERDWYTVRARRGEVLWIEAFGDRINSPVDLDVSVLDLSGEKELARFSDEVHSIGGTRFPSQHSDPAGRWVVPADGRYLIVVRNLIGGLDGDPRRVYRLSVRREEADYHLAVVPRTASPASLNVSRGGRTMFDVLAFRQRGLTGPIRVTAKNLPEGIECPDIWLGPGVNLAPLTVTANENAAPFAGPLVLEGHAEQAGRRTVQAGTVVRTGLPGGWGRLTDGIPVAVRGDAPLRITADGHETREHHLYGELKVRHSPGGIVDVAVHVERRNSGHSAPVNLIGVGLPPRIANQTATIPAGVKKGYISFYLPPTLPVGRYTLAVQAQTTVSPSPGKTQSVTVVSNPVTFHVQRAAFVVEVDRYAPKKISRGQVIQVKYSAKRSGGFINKIHTELAAPGKVIGIRGRGVTFVGQTESGTIQIIANDDAPLGRIPFLRLFAVGVLEDEAVFHGSCFLDLEITK